MTTAYIVNLVKPETKKTPTLGNPAQTCTIEEKIIKRILKTRKTKLSCRSMYLLNTKINKKGKVEFEMKLTGSFKHPFK